MDPPVPPCKLISRGVQKFNRGGPKKISARFARQFKHILEICTPLIFLFYPALSVLVFVSVCVVYVYRVRIRLCVCECDSYYVCTCFA